MTDTNIHLQPRPPVVVVMGHVDHGKTTLLDYVRKANVAAREAGGITQAMGAYEVTHSPINADISAQISADGNQRESASPVGRKITFIDTPGHEAFSKMRARGANVADLAILVVAADEGVKPQTEEAIRILNETKTPFVVAMTKIDKPGANVDKLKNDLAGAGVLLEGYGGSVSYHEVSAKTGQGVDGLLDLILLAADYENLTYNPDASASGYVLESRRTKQRGNDVSVIVKDGTLRVNDALATETATGKVKILENFLGKAVKSLEPSAPALITGFETLPEVGEIFTVGGTVAAKKTNGAVSAKGPKSYADAEAKTLNVILKGGDAGSLEALSGIIRSMKFELPVKIVNESVGEVGDNDVKLAVSTGSIIVGFKARVHKAAAILAEAQRVKIVTSEIIYDLTKALEDALLEGQGGALEAEFEVLKIFNAEKLDRQLVGGKVLSGTMRGRGLFELRRGSEAISTGKIVSLREGKKDATSVPEGREAGVVVASLIALMIGDRIAVKKG